MPQRQDRVPLCPWWVPFHPYWVFRSTRLSEAAMADHAGNRPRAVIAGDSLNLADKHGVPGGGSL